jgi:hypothetical protein
MDQRERLNIKITGKTGHILTISKSALPSGFPDLAQTCNLTQDCPGSVGDMRFLADPSPNLPATSFFAQAHQIGNPPTG